MRRLGLEVMTKDRGAVAVLFAIVIVLLMGFVGLGVDVTSAYAKSQEIQNAADAGAIAEAQQCGSEGGCTKAEAQAIAEANVRSGNVAAETGDPIGNTIKVTVTGENQNHFASLFGFDKFAIVRDATATWETPSAATTMLPIAVSLCAYDAMSKSDVPFVIKLPKKDETGCIDASSSSLAPAMFGYIGNPKTSCTVHVEADGWVNGEKANNPPDACDAAALRKMVDNREVILMPVFDECRSSAPNTPECTPFTPGPGQTSTQFRIKGFAALELHGVKLGGGGTDYAYPQPATGWGCTGEERCILGKFVEWVLLADAPVYGETPDYGATVVVLID